MLADLGVQEYPVPACTGNRTVKRLFKVSATEAPLSVSVRVFTRARAAGSEAVNAFTPATAIPAHRIIFVFIVLGKFSGSVRTGLSYTGFFSLL